jgi:hypothetical protein
VGWIIDRIDKLDWIIDGGIKQLPESLGLPGSKSALA